MKEFFKRIVFYLTEIGFPFTFLSSIWLLAIKKVGIGKMSDAVFMKVGLLPVRDHYYEPLINPKKHLKNPLSKKRNLPAIDLNIDEQLEILSQFDFNEELLSFPMDSKSSTEYCYNNGAYGSGDGEYLYNMIRHFKPKRIIEIGSGLSTLMAQNAIQKNKSEDGSYSCQHVCIEPYEMDWLKDVDVELKRELVENVDHEYFKQLGENDILFIDSSHIIRPQGDVLHEYLELLPIINKGVIIHVHDIFTPRDYPAQWVIEEHRLWNEQYLLEAFLSFNKDFRIIGAVNYLSHEHHELFSEKCPIYAQQPGREPAAFWMKKN